MILKTLTVGPFMANCYVVGSKTGGEGMIIDPGAEPDAILNTVSETGLDIKLIVATHSHIDHVGAVKQIMAKTGAAFAIHEAAGQGEVGEELSRYLEEIMGESLPKTPPPDRLLKDRDIIRIGDLQFTILHVPGHSPGDIALSGHGIIFTGDTLFQFGIGRTDLPGGNYAQLMNGIFTKLMALPDETIVYSGHGPHSTIGTERKGNPFLREWIAHKD